MTDDRAADSNGGSDDASSGDAPVDLVERVEDLHAHLAATAELPIDPTTNRWLGEAESVAKDASSSDLDRETRLRRVRQVERLLSAADDPEHEEAAAHLDAARKVCGNLLATDPE